MSRAGSPEDRTYEAVIGLEVHVQLETETKLFCGCSTRFGGEPNTQICAVCTGQPGALPVLNRRAVELAVRIALASGCAVRRDSRFARKNYFYPDLPKGFQISQYAQPLAEGGAVEIELDGTTRAVRLTRIHLEEDAGKSVHLPGRGGALVDYNRAGVPLIEVVSEPDLRSPQEAAEYMRTLRSIVRALGVSDGNLEQGSLRCDANVSLRPRTTERLGTKVEVKNINSFRFVQRALSFEIERQRELLARGEPIARETRLWNEQRGETAPMRSKEEAHDYRYFPEPDLPPLSLDEAWIEKLKSELPPELPLQRCRRLQRQQQLSAEQAHQLTRERELADYHLAAVEQHGAPAALSASFLTGSLGCPRDPRELDPASAPVSPASYAKLLALIDDEKVSFNVARDKIWPAMWESGTSAEEIAREQDLLQQSDRAAIAAQVQQVLDDHPEQVAQYRGGKKKVLGFLVGQVMKRTRGKANPRMVNELLRDELGSSDH